MPYRIMSFDVLEAPKSITLAPHEDGIAVVYRRKSVPVGFVMKRIDEAGPIDVSGYIDQRIQERIVAAAAREELTLRRADCSALSITVAICTRDRPELVARCLRSLVEKQSPPTPGFFEIILIDNAPATTLTRRMVDTEFPAVRYVFEPKPGLNFARNAALRAARGDLVAFVDDDVVVDAGWLHALMEAWADDPGAGLFTGQVLPLELETPAQILFEQRGGFRRGFARVHFGSSREGDPLYPCRAEILGTGANMALRRSAAVAIGGFDEALDMGGPLPGGGDLDMFYRMIRSGHGAVYEPGFLAFHQHRRDLRALRRQYRDSWGKAYMAFVVKSWCRDPAMRRKWTHTAVRWFCQQLVHVLKCLAGRGSRPIGMVLAEAYGGLLGLMGSYGKARRRAAEISAANS